MKLLTDEQIIWMLRKEIKVDNMYSLPNSSFKVYENPYDSSGCYVETNPFNRSLSHEMFIVKQIDGMLVKGNFYQKPLYKDFYLELADLELRGVFQSLFLFVVCSIPMIVYNLFKRKLKPSRGNR